LPSLSIARYEPQIRRLTIGSITAKTHPYSGDDGIEYMANETGVGSGSIYRESQLFESEAAARVTAGAEAAIKNAEIDATPRVTKARQFSGLTYTDAALVALKDGIFNSWQAFRSLGYAIESALPEDSNNDTDDQQAVREAIERYGKYGGTYLPVERHPIDALLEALDAEGAERSDAVREAINTLRRIAGIADHPENPPCTCRHIGLYSRESGCPRHGAAEGSF
jgi:hypothetical protein